MKRRFGLPTLLMSCLLCIALTAGVTVTLFQRLVNSSLADLKELRTTYHKLIAVEELVERRFVGEIDEQLLTDTLLQGYAYGLDDPYTYYLTAEEYKTSTQELEGDFAGIGIQVMADENGEIYVSNVLIGSPAESAEVRHGDVIIAVEGRSVLEIGYATAVNDLLGVEGTTANFTVRRDVSEGRQINFSVVRQKFSMTTVTGKMLESGLGYIRITEYDMSTPAQFAAVLDNLLAQGADGLIFDMRDNPGGELQAICTILDRLVPAGPIIEIKDKEGRGEVIKSDATELSLPMAVLVNGNTASAAELFSATLRDYDKAQLVGTTTYGKGSVQTIYPLGDGTAMHLTSGLYYPPSGVSYNGIGLVPDWIVELPKTLAKKIFFLTHEEDVQLQKAEEVLASAIQAAPSDSE